MRVEGSAVAVQPRLPPSSLVCVWDGRRAKISLEFERSSMRGRMADRIEGREGGGMRTYQRSLNDDAAGKVIHFC